MSTQESQNRIKIEALSCPSPKNTDVLIQMLDNNFSPIQRRSLIVLPEYFLRGEDLFGGIMVSNPLVKTLIRFAQEKRTHIVTGMVEQEMRGNKYITGLFISPKGLVEKQRKQIPTSFERSSGIVSGQAETQTFNLEEGLGTLSIAMCIESFKLDSNIRRIPADILVNPRGFDLNDPKYGSLSDAWLSHNQDLARMGKRFVVGATGYMGKTGSLAEIIDFEGNILAHTIKPLETVSATANLDLLREYRNGTYQSKTVPRF
jgi:predicted amidohydrolase